MNVLEKFREELRGRELDGYILYRRDPHLNEYLHPHYNQVAHLTGFTGSNATLLVVDDKAYLFTDSRYFLQAEQELPKGIQLAKMGEDLRMSELLQQYRDRRIGVDPRYFTEEEYLKLAEKLRGTVELVLVRDDLVGPLWSDRPAIQSGPLVQMANQVPVSEKLARVRQCLVPGSSPLAAEEALSGVVIADMDEIAWLTNLRGTDVPSSRLFYAYLYLTADQAVLFTNSTLEQPLAGVEVRPYESLEGYLGEINNQAVGASASTNYHLCRLLKENQNQVHRFLAVERMKAVKTTEEIRGFEEANLRDSVALCRLFGHLGKLLSEKQVLGEIDAANWLEQIKREDAEFIAPSFESISAYGANGAVIHYGPKNNAVKIGTENLFLLDSGSQYTMGTTDITRTVAFGTPTEAQQRHYTAVIKGHIALETTRFPEETALGGLAAIVRQAVWQVGENYQHGTGHGVGYGLNVHEGPHFLEPSSQEKAKVGMVVTNEPGVYIEGEYGIRHENLMVVEPDKEVKKFLVLRNLTPAPLHQALLKVDMLTAAEIKYLNRESQRIRELLSPLLANFPEGLAWLEANTRELSGSEAQSKPIDARHPQE